MYSPKMRWNRLNVAAFSLVVGLSGVACGSDSGGPGAAAAGRARLVGLAARGLRAAAGQPAVEVLQAAAGRLAAEARQAAAERPAAVARQALVAPRVAAERPAAEARRALVARRVPVVAPALGTLMAPWWICWGAACPTYP